MPGDDLLFQRLSVSTIGAVRFHGRVRDGIGWGTDAMVTKQYGLRLIRVFDAVPGSNLAITHQSLQMLSGSSHRPGHLIRSRALLNKVRRTDIDSAGSQA